CVRRGPSLSWGRQEGGSGGTTWNRAVVLRGRGGSGFPPSAFPDWSPLLSVYLCSRAVVFLTSLSLLCEGVRSGTRRRRGASASAQAGGGDRAGIAAHSARTGGRCAVRALCGTCAGRAGWGGAGPRPPRGGRGAGGRYIGPGGGG